MNHTQRQSWTPYDAVSGLVAVPLLILAVMMIAGVTDWLTVSRDAIR